MVIVISDTEPAVRVSAWQDVLSTVASGALVGLFTWLLTYIFSKYIIGIIACQNSNSLMSCSSNEVVSAGFGLVIASIAGLIFLVRRRIFRPLLVVLAAGISLWGINGSWLSDASIVNLFLTVILTAVMYGVFGWFGKVRAFWLSALISVVLVILFRLIISL